MTDKRDLILRELLNNFEINDDNSLSISGSFSKIDEYHHYLTLLRYEALEIDRIKRKLECIRYYFEFPNEPDFIESKSILVSLKKQQNPSFELFIDLLHNKLASFKQGIQVKKYTLYYPVNINELKSEITEFHIGDSVIKLLNYSDVKYAIDNINFDEMNMYMNKE